LKERGVFIFKDRDFSALVEEGCTFLWKDRQDLLISLHGVTFQKIRMLI